MAPELRKRKTVTEATLSNGTVKKVEKVTKSKRKAPEDASPASLKKLKPSAKTDATSKQKPAQSSKPGKESKEEQYGLLEVSGSEDSENADDQAQTLALEVDSDDDNNDDLSKSTFKSGQDVGKVPKVLKQLVTQSSGTSKGEPGVIYIGRIPHGFYEHEMKQYFAQFGPITRLRLSRNKKTGASKHFAFVEFAEASTAEIVAKTMDNYLLFGHILKCKMIPKESVHKDLFKGANKRFKRVPWNKIAGKQLHKPLSSAQWEGKVLKEQSKREKKMAKLAELGYDFEVPSIKEVPEVPTIENGDNDTVVTEKIQVEQSNPTTGVSEAAVEQKSKKAQKGSKTKRAKAT